MLSLSPYSHALPDSVGWRSRRILRSSVEEHAILYPNLNGITMTSAARQFIDFCGAQGPTTFIDVPFTL